MTTAQITVNAEGTGAREVLALTEQAGFSAGLDKKSALRLRLLAEELLGLFRSIAGEVASVYRLERDGRSFVLHMTAKPPVTEKMKEQFLAASSTGKNDATRGFMGKIGALIAGALVAAKDASPYFSADADPVFILGAVEGDGAAWSLAYYRERLRASQLQSEEAARARDELERSIVAAIADDVKVRILGNKVEIRIYKSF